MARAAASVAPEVKTTSCGRAPSAAATWSRATVEQVAGARPAACTEDGFPNAVEGARASPPAPRGAPA